MIENNCNYEEQFKAILDKNTELLSEHDELLVRLNKMSVELDETLEYKTRLEEKIEILTAQLEEETTLRKYRDGQVSAYEYVLRLMKGGAKDNEKSLFNC